MIEIQYTDGRSCPVVHCDVCRELVKAGGLYVWRTARGQECSRIYFVHKGRCDRALSAQLGATSWNELSALPAFLAHNLGITPDDAENAARRSEDVTFALFDVFGGPDS